MILERILFVLREQHQAGLEPSRDRPSRQGLRTKASVELSGTTNAVVGIHDGGGPGRDRRIADSDNKRLLLQSLQR